MRHLVANISSKHVNYTTPIFRENGLWLSIFTSGPFIILLTPQRQSFRQGIVMRTSFKTRVSWVGSDSFVKNENNYFYILFSFFIFSKSKSTEMLTPQKGNFGHSGTFFTKSKEDALFQTFLEQISDIYQGPELRKLLS